MRRRCPECGRIKSEKAFWWGAKRCRSCVARQSGEKRSRDASNWKDYVKREYGLAIGISQKLYGQYHGECVGEAEEAIPKRTRNHIADYLVIGGPIFFLASLVAVFLALGERSSLPVAFGLFVVAFAMSILGDKLNAERNRLVATLAKTFLREKLKEHEQSQLEYEAFYSTDEWKRLRERIIERDGCICAECGKRIKSDKDLTIDHIKPRSLFPELALDPNNLQVLCRRCNSAKGTLC